MKKQITPLILLAALSIIVSACGGATSTPAPKPKIGVVLDTGGVNDKGFNQTTLTGVQQAAEETGLEMIHVVGLSTDYEGSIESVIAEDVGLVVTVGFTLGDATATVARRHPDIRFVIVDNAYLPGFGCPDTVDNCYTEQGGLPNVTSLMFAEDEAGYLAGVLAGCMTQTNTVAAVAGMEIPPVVKFLTGFKNGAQSVNPDIVTLHQYIPDFNDPATGKVVGQDFIRQGADIIFGVGGHTGNGGLLAAKEAGLMTIGVDVDQYLTFPEVQESLISSAMKNMDVAAAAAVKEFAAGKLSSGIKTATMANNGVGLAPYHDWDNKIPQDCKDQVKAAEETLRSDPTITGYQPPE